MKKEQEEITTTTIIQIRRITRQNTRGVHTNKYRAKKNHKEEEAEE